MLDFLVGLSIYSLYIAIIGTLLFLPVIRLLIVVIRKYDLRKALQIIFIPLSIGYYLNADKKHITHTLYVTIQVILFIATLLGSIFLFYTRFA